MYSWEKKSELKNLLLVNNDLYATLYRIGNIFYLYIQPFYEDLAYLEIRLGATNIQDAKRESIRKIRKSVQEKSKELKQVRIGLMTENQKGDL